MANARLARPFWATKSGLKIPLGFAAHGKLGLKHNGGTWHYVKHTVGGRTYKSHYLTGESWDATGAVIYRVRPGNGFFGSVPYKKYKDQYPYFIPRSINNPQGEAARAALKQAVYNWQNVLTEAEKIEYNKRATKGLRMSGYNLYIREYIKNHI
jgi:hypothetical protein